MNNYYRSIPSENISDYEEYYRKVAEALPDESLIVECGIANGRGIILMASLMKFHGKRCRIFGVDNMDYGKENQRNDVMTNIIRSREDTITIKVKSSLDASCDFEDNSVDFCFIDSSHKYETTRAEILLWTRKIKEGGIIAFHDYTNESETGVKQAVDEMFDKKIINVEETTFNFGVAWVKKENLKLC